MFGRDYYVPVRASTTRRAANNPQIIWKDTKHRKLFAQLTVIPSQLLSSR